MAFQTPITIKKALDGIQRHDFVLPAIQREFVWKPMQICRLFDSLMKGYPIGSFLFWKVDRGNTRRFKFYDFMREYHQRDNPHCSALNLTGDREVTAILDGQQRLTALNIGLLGSHATKEPRMWWDNPGAFPEKRLYLNLLGTADDNEEGMRYDFQFVSADRAAQRDAKRYWFPVSAIMDMKSGSAIHRHLLANGMAESDLAFEQIERLHEIVHTTPIVNYFLEEEQDLDKVLNIFIRVNSGGTVLSYSDLLLSIATAQWEGRDAREEIHSLVDELNGTREGFAFSKDFVLKAGLMLTDIASVGFKVTNFNAENMATLAQDWPHIENALKLTVRMVADFGFSGQSLSADSALLPIAYYLHKRRAGESYLRSREYQADREAIRQWLIRSILKAGVWGSGLDTMLTAIRSAIQEHGEDRFPVAEVEAVMARRGRSLQFTEDEIQDLADIKYGDKRAFPLLSLMFTFTDLRNEFHLDHVFPRSRFTQARLTKAGVAPDVIPAMMDACDRLGNLQMLHGTANLEKNAKMPDVWAAEHYTIEADRVSYCERHDLGTLPDSLSGFREFYDLRRAKLVRRLRGLLGIAAEGAGQS